MAHRDGAEAAKASHSHATLATVTWGHTPSRDPGRHTLLPGAPARYQRYAAACRYQSPLPVPYGSYIKLYSSNHDKPQNQNRCTAATAHALAAWLKNAQSVRIAACCACVTRNHYPHACSGGSSRARRCCSRSSMHKYIHPWGAAAVAAAAAAPEG